MAEQVKPEDYDLLTFMDEHSPYFAATARKLYRLERIEKQLLQLYDRWGGSQYDDYKEKEFRQAVADIINGEP